MPFGPLPTRGSAPPDLARTISRPLPTRGVGTPRSGEDDLEAAPDEGGRHPRSGEDDFEVAPDEGVGTPGSRKDDFEGPDDGVRVTCPAWYDAVICGTIAKNARCVPDVTLPVLPLMVVACPRW
jgi:hypothetical protein